MPRTEVTLETPFLTGLEPSWEGKHALTDCYVNVGGIDVSNRCSAVRVAFEREAIDITGFEAAVSGYREYMPGKLEGTFAFELFYDPSLTSMWNALKAGPLAVEVRPHQYPAGEGNPAWLATCVATNTRSLFGDVGQAASSSIELRSTGTIEELLA